VIGAGSRDTAFNPVLAQAEYRTAFWARRPELTELLRRTRENPEHLPWGPAAPLPDLHLRAGPRVSLTVPKSFR